MKRLDSFSLILFLTLAVILSESPAQQPITVPRDSTVAVIAGKRISVSYGRPSTLGRRIMGDYVQYNKVWRTGAGQSTQLTTDADLELGGMEIPRGAYSLYTFPSESQWKLIINKQVGQWGTVYNPQQDLARIALDKRTLPNNVEKLTFAIERGNNSSGILKMEWEHTSLSVPFKVSPTLIVASPRDSTKLVLAGKTLTVNYGRPSARGRKIIGSVVPYNQVWRTGANEATTLTTESDILLGGATVPKGTYSLFTLPSKKTWQLIINKETGQSGLVYHPRLDLARIKLQKHPLTDYVERLTISLNHVDNRSGLLKIEWERTSLLVPFSLKTN
jgi:hypothetical protein